MRIYFYFIYTPSTYFSHKCLVLFQQLYNTQVWTPYSVISDKLQTMKGAARNQLEQIGSFYSCWPASDLRSRPTKSLNQRSGVTATLKRLERTISFPTWLQSSARCLRAILRCHFSRDNDIPIYLSTLARVECIAIIDYPEAIMDNESTSDERNKMSNGEQRRCHSIYTVRRQ